MKMTQDWNELDCPGNANATLKAIQCTKWHVFK